MPLKRQNQIRKFLAGLVLPLLLSGCITDNIYNPFASAPPAPPPLSVSEMTSPTAPSGVPPLYCKIGRGSAIFGRDWYDFSDALFTLNKGVPANIALTRVNSTQQMTLQALFDGQGQKLIFCPFLNLQQGERIACASEYVLEDDLQDGVKRTFDIPEAVRGAFITCAYAQDHLRSLITGTN